MSAQLPDRAIQLGRRIVERFHHAVMTGNERLMKAGDRHYNWLLAAINGGTTFGCRAGAESPACLLERGLAAPDGETPLWGQSGRMLIVVNGMPGIVNVESGLDSFGVVHFEFHACTADMPFISETGYRSDFVHRVSAGLTVREAAEERFRALQEDVRLIRADWKLDEDFRDAAFVANGLRNLAATVPVPGTRVWLKKQIGLVTSDAEATAAGKLSIALFAVEKDGRRRKAPLSTVVNRHVWPWDVRKADEAELKSSADPGKYLTLGMVDAIRAVHS